VRPGLARAQRGNVSGDLRALSEHRAGVVVLVVLVVEGAQIRRAEYVADLREPPLIVVREIALLSVRKRDLRLLSIRVVRVAIGDTVDRVGKYP
jgi:hypothetical protein